MNAQEYKPRDEKNPIQLSDEYTLYQKERNIEDKDIVIWELYLKKDKKLSLLDKQEVKRNNIKKLFLSLIRLLNKRLMILQC